ncbi:hypothetical protein QYE76_002396 [Lolium multiflorum]|uniref:Uncharacterized protein n=1 Tax=Lolium multiflorum TaxID=4521 RepID=A0AAD8W0L1_LOLMU|nr:hypothetical protein QYE76_002396 [Lolium multiflorum]
MMRPKDKGGIGFKDMRLFNQALLAKQAWSLLQQPDNLCAQVLKAKYYPQGLLTDTVFSGNASPTWRGIEYGLELVKKGMIWRIVNGASVRAWRAPWIPRESFLKPITRQGRCRLRWVSDFLNPDGSWNEQLLDRWFLPIDVQEILKIRTSNRNEGDFIAWHHEKLGMFTNQNVDTDKGKQSIDEVKGFSKKGKSIEDRPHIKQKWNPPDEGDTKLNVDGAFSHDG